jgi:hypothetical protein
MLSFKEFLHDTVVESVNEVSKGIYTHDGKKVNLERSSKLSLNILYSDDTLKAITWKQWKESTLPVSSSEGTQDKFVKALLGTFKEFNKKVDYNTWVKRGGANSTFEEKVDKLISLGAKIPKGGIKG